MALKVASISRDEPELPSLEEMRGQIGRIDTKILDTIAKHRDGTRLDEDKLMDELREIIEMARIKVWQMARGMMGRGEIKQIGVSGDTESSFAIDEEGKLEEVAKRAMELVAKRVDVARVIGAIKKEKGMEVYDPQREEGHLKSLSGLAEGRSLPVDRVQLLFRDIMALCREVQKTIVDTGSDDKSRLQRRPTR